MKKFLCVILSAALILSYCASVLGYEVQTEGDELFENLSDKIFSVTVNGYDIDGNSTIGNKGNRVRLYDGDRETAMNVFRNVTRSGDITFKFTENINLNKIVLYDIGRGTKKFKIFASLNGDEWEEIYSYDKAAESVKYCYFNNTCASYIKFDISEVITSGETSYYNINLSEIEFYNVKRDIFRLENAVSMSNEFLLEAESSDKPYYPEKLTVLNEAVTEGEAALSDLNISQLEIEAIYNDIIEKYNDASRFLNYSEEEYNKLLSNRKGKLTAAEESWTNAQKGYFNPTVNTAQNLLKTMVKDNSSTLWEETGSVESMIASGSNKAFIKVYNNIKTMARAYTHKYSSLKGNAELKSGIEYAIGILNEYYYGKVEWFGSNLWNFLIGLQSASGEIVALLYDEIDSELLREFALNAYSELRPDYMEFTGTNCYDIAFGAALYGAYLNYDYLIENLINKLLSDCVYNNTKGSGSGYYTDGSYLFHGNVPYTGGYGYIGYVYFNDIFTLVNNSKWNIDDTSDIKEFMKRSVYETYLPKLISGHSPMVFNGRAITSLNNEKNVGINILAAITDTAYLLGGEDQEKILSHVKGHITVSGSDSWKSAGYSSLWKVMTDSSVVAAESENYNRVYSFEDRIIHKQSNYAMTLSMYSKWISRFESLNGQNSKGWLSNAGATYFYDSDITHYTDKYLHLYDYTRVPGVTAEKIEYPSVNSLTAEMSTAENSFAGGVTIGGLYGAAGFQPDNYNSDLTANKSYYMFDNEIVMIGSEINSSGAVETTVDQRIVEDHTAYDFKIGNSYLNAISADDVSYENVSSAYIKGRTADSSFGYYFPVSTTLKANKNFVSKSSKDTDWYTYTDNDIQTGTISTLVIDHGNSPENEGYSYAVLPGYSEAEISAYEENPDISILSDTGSWHGVYEKNLNIWSIVNFENSIADSGILSTDKKSAVMMQKTEDKINLAISDPTCEGTEKVTITVNENASSVISCDENLKVVSLSPIIIEANVSNTQGKTMEISLDTSESEVCVPVVESFIYYDYGISNGDLIRITNKPSSVYDKRLALMFVKICGIENMECGLAYSSGESSNAEWSYLPHKSISDGLETFGMCLSADLSNVFNVCPYVKEMDGNIILFEENMKKIIPLPLNQPSLERWNQNNKMNNTEFIVFEIK